VMWENGAGETTRITALTGVSTIAEGTVMVSGRSGGLGGTADAQAAGSSTVYKEVNLCTNLSIGENVMLGYEVRGPFGTNWAATHRSEERRVGKGGRAR